MKPVQAVEVRGLRVTYPDGRRALDDISFNIGRGSSVAILGANGAGKSTLLLALVGVLPTSGEIIVDGELLTDKTLRSIRRKVQLVFQYPNDQLFMPVLRDDVAFGPINYGTAPSEAKEVVRASLAAVGLEGFEERSPHNLSAGERKRAALATSLACNPYILLLDEPTAGLDPRGQAGLMELIENLKSRGVTLIMASHDLSFVFHTADRVLVLSEDHRLIADGPTKAVLGNADLLLSVNLIHEHTHRHGDAFHAHLHRHDAAHEHDHKAP